MKKIITLILANFLIFGILMIGIPAALAAVGISPDLRPEYAPQGREELANPEAPADDKFGVRSINFIIGDFVVVLLQIAGVLAVWFVTSSALGYVKAFGKDENMDKAKKGLIWSLAGLVIIIMAYAIVQNVLRIVLTTDESAISMAHFLS